jgi:hypothetical protein
MGNLDSIKKVGKGLLIGVGVVGIVGWSGEMPPPPPPHLLTQSERGELKFQVVRGHADVNLLGGFADGRYYLKKWKIEKRPDGLYYFKIVYQKDRGRFHSIQNLELYGKVKKSILYLYDPETEKLYPLNFKSILHAQKVKGGYNFYYIYPTRSVRIDRGRSNFYFTLKARGE